MMTGWRVADDINQQWSLSARRKCILGQPCFLMLDTECQIQCLVQRSQEMDVKYNNVKVLSISLRFLFSSAICFKVFESL